MNRGGDSGGEFCICSIKYGIIPKAILPDGNHSPQIYFVFSMGVMALMPVNATVDAHYQEDRGINRGNVSGNESVRINEEILTVECTFY